MSNDASSAEIIIEPANPGSTATSTQQETSTFSWQSLLDDTIAFFDLIADTVIALQIATYFNRLYVLGLAINATDAILGMAAGIAQMINARLAKRHHVQKFLWGFADTILNAQIISFGVVASLIKYGKITGTAASVGTVLFSFAACAIMWAAVLNSAARGYKAWNKCNPVYLAQDRLIKYQLITNKLAQLADDNPQREALEEVQARLKFQAIALAKHAKQQQLSFAKNHVNQQPIDLLIKDTFAIDLNTPLSKKEKKVVQHLLTKQQEKRAAATIATLEWIVGAVGVTLIAFSPLLPVLAIPGLILSFLASISQLLHLINQHFFERFAQSQAITDKKTQILAATTLLQDEQTLIVPKTMPIEWLASIDTLLQDIAQTELQLANDSQINNLFALIYCAYMQNPAYTGNSANFKMFFLNFILDFNHANYKRQNTMIKQLQKNYASYCENLYLAFCQTINEPQNHTPVEFETFVNQHFLTDYQQQEKILAQASEQVAQDAIIMETLGLENRAEISLVISEKDRESILRRYANKNYSISNQIITFFTGYFYKIQSLLKMNSPAAAPAHASGNPISTNYWLDRFLQSMGLNHEAPSIKMNDGISLHEEPVIIPASDINRSIQ